MVDNLHTDGSSKTQGGAGSGVGDHATPFILSSGAHETIAGATDEVAQFNPGDVVANRFRIEECVGRGGMGLVYRAVDGVMRQRVALKTVLPSVLADPRAAARFVQEVNIARRLRHPGIVAVYDVGQHGALLYYTMEFLDGESLRSILNKRGRLPLREAIRILYPLCEALEHAHGVTVHRDISPENVMLQRDGTARLLDFGIAKAIDPALARRQAQTATATSMGKAYYMAPEQRRDAARVDRRADIYSVGVMFFEMLTGDMPMGVARVTERVPDLPAKCDEVIAKALAPIDKRYRSARELALDLKACYEASGQAAPQSQTPKTEPAPKETARPAADTPPPQEAAKQPDAAAVPDSGQTKTALATLAEGEELIWEGMASFMWFLPGVFWAAGWGLLWTYAYREVHGLVLWIQSTGALSEVAVDVTAYETYVGYVALGLAALAYLGVVRRILRFLASRYVFTTHRIVVRQGCFSREMKQYNLARFKDISMRQSFWGAIWGYGHIMAKASPNQIGNEYDWRGIPRAPKIAERLQSSLAGAQRRATIR